MIASALYAGEVLHARSRPVSHSFVYPALQLLVDVDELSSVARRLRLFSYGGVAPFAIRDRDYLGAGRRGIAHEIRRFLVEHGAPAARDRVLLLTHPRMLGYVFNPVSFFYCHDDRGALRAIVAEVNNTFGDTHRYLFDSRNRVVHAHAEHTYEHDKLLHVSPFISMQARYRFAFPMLPACDGDPDGSPLEIRVDETEGGRPLFTARFSLTRRELTDRNLLGLLLRTPLAALQVTTRIHWQALRLWLRGAPFHHAPVYNPRAAEEMHARSRVDARTRVQARPPPRDQPPLEMAARAGGSSSR